MSPEEQAAEAHAHENTYDNEFSQVRNAFLAGIEWARNNPPECPACHYKPGAL